MIHPIRRVAVLGAGTMGSQIAAHLANASVPCLLLDRVPEELSDEEKTRNLSLSHPEVRTRFARGGLQFALKTKPAAFFTPDLQAFVEVGNFEDDLQKLAHCDWILEAVIENLAAKQALWARVLPLAKPAAIVSSNTSGIPLHSIAAAFPPPWRRRWAGTHFFNPPRYMRLVEIIPTQETDAEVVVSLRQFCERFLGKLTALARD